MIEIADSPIDANIINQFTQESIESKIVNILSSSNKVYKYDSENQLIFELSLRKSIIKAAKDLSLSRVSFRVFRKSKCNTDYWNRTNEGGFILKSGVKPSEAVKDIYINSSYYGTECSTAIVIIYYKAFVDIFPEDLFNEWFSKIYLLNWQHLDHNLNIVEYPGAADYLPGDCRYFKNPDVDPLTPEWRGENVIDMGYGAYYGHGIGIASAESIIGALNRKRIKGSKVSAYLLDSTKRPNFKYLADKYYNY